MADEWEGEGYNCDICKRALKDFEEEDIEDLFIIQSVVIIKCTVCSALLHLHCHTGIKAGDTNSLIEVSTLTILALEQ